MIMEYGINHPEELKQVHRCYTSKKKHDPAKVYYYQKNILGSSSAYVQIMDIG
ncbi:hypothetical protein YC2023_085524 [Brassica napus]